MTFDDLLEQADNFAALSDVDSFTTLSHALEDEDLPEEDEMGFRSYLEKRQAAVSCRLSGAIMEAEQHEYEADMLEAQLGVR